MKPTDLMIGDWVMYNPNVFVEDEYEPVKACYPTRIENVNDIELAEEPMCYSGIPLNEAILRNNSSQPAKETSEEVISLKISELWNY